MTDTSRENVERVAELITEYPYDFCYQTSALLLALLDRAEKAEADLASLRCPNCENLRLELGAMRADLAALTVHAEAMARAWELLDFNDGESEDAMEESVFSYRKWKEGKR